MTYQGLIHAQAYYDEVEMIKREPKEEHSRRETDAVSQPDSFDRLFPIIRLSYNVY